MGVLALAESSDGQTGAALAHVHQALARAGDLHQAELASGAMLAGMLCYWRGHFQDAVESSRHALFLAQEISDTSSMAQAIGNLGLALSGQGRYTEAFEMFKQTCSIARERGTRRWLARALACWGGVHLELYDFAGAEALALEAREVSRALNWSHAETSAGIDLMFNFARRGEVERAESLVDEVAQAVASAQGAHGWLWRLRFAAARGEIALARGAWAEAILLAEGIIVESERTGRLKYHVRGLETQAHALAVLGRVQEAIALLQNAVKLVRATADPVLFVRAASALMSLCDDNTLLLEAQAQVQMIVQALPNEDLQRCFLGAEALRPLMR